MSKPSELREQTEEQLDLLLKEVQHSLFRLRLQSETERLEAPSEIVKAKREIARIKTILRLREIERAQSTLAAAALFNPVFEAALNSGKTRLVAHIYEDGRLGCIQPIGAAPGDYTATASYVFGTGAFMLAGSEVDRLAR